MSDTVHFKCRHCGLTYVAKTAPRQMERRNVKGNTQRSFAARADGEQRIVELLYDRYRDPTTTEISDSTIEVASDRGAAARTESTLR